MRALRLSYFSWIYFNDRLCNRWLKKRLVQILWNLSPLAAKHTSVHLCQSTSHLQITLQDLTSIRTLTQHGQMSLPWADVLLWPLLSFSELCCQPRLLESLSVASCIPSSKLATRTWLFQYLVLPISLNQSFQNLYPHISLLLFRAHLLTNCFSYHWHCSELKTSTCRDGTPQKQPNKIGTTPQPSLHLVTFCQLCLVFVTCVPCCQLCLVCYCVHRGVVLGMEGCGMSSTVVVYGEWVVVLVATILLQLGVAGMVS